MDCEHKRVKSVNCVIYCMDCGKVIPVETLARELEKPAMTRPKRTKKKAD